MELVAFVTLLGMEGNILGAVISSGEVVYFRERPGDVSRGKIYLAYLVVCFREHLVNIDTCLDPDASHNLATIVVICQVSHFFDRYRYPLHLFLP